MGEAVERAWSAPEDIELLTLIEQGLSIGDIASHLGRNVADCSARLDEITRAADGVFPRETAAS